MKIAAFYLFITLFFSSCATYDKIGQYPEEFDIPKRLQIWEHLLLLPQEYPPKSYLSSFKHSYYLDKFKSTNPGFIDLSSFRYHFKEHPLKRLKHWYEASFYLDHSIIHYMVMQFASIEEAQAYLPRLRAETPEKALKILRLEDTLFSFQVHDYHGNLINQDDDKLAYQWVQETLTKIKERL